MTNKENRSPDEPVAGLVHESEQKIFSILAGITDCYYELDPHWRFIRINDRALTYFGVKKEDVVGQLFWNVFPTVKESVFEDQYKKVISESVSVHFDAQSAIVPDKWAEIHAYPSGKGGIWVFFRDITDLKRAAEETKRLAAAVQGERDRLSALINSVQDEVWFADRDGRFTLANLSALQEFSLNTSTEEIRVEELARGLEVYRSDASPRPVDEAPPLRALKGEVVKNQEEIIRTPGSGELRYREVSAAPVRDAANNIIGSVSVVRDITDRKRVEEALRQSEERLRFALETIHAGAWDLDLVDHSAFRSIEHDRIFGYDHLLPEWTYEMFLEHVVPEDRVMVDDKFQRAVEHRTDWNFECRIHRVDGQVRWIWAAGRHAQDAAGLSRRMSGVVQDITERKQMEGELQRSERLYRAIGESIDYGVWVCAPDGRNIYASESFLKMVGQTQEECSSFGWGNVLHPDDAERTIAAWQECVRAVGVWDIEHRFRGVDGQYHHVLARGIPVRDEQGQILCWAGINLDIDNLKQMQEDLRRNRDELGLRVAERTADVERERKRLYDVLETLPAMICLLTPDHHVAFANRSFRTRFGEPEGRHCYDFCFGNIQPCEFCESYEVLKTGRPHHWECNTPDGYIIDAYDFPFTDVDGSPLILEMDIDITERKQAEAALRMMGSYNRSLIEASVDPLVTINPEGRISDVNVATERITGYSRDKLIGTDFSDYFTDPKKAKVGYRLVFNEGMVKDYELEIRYRDGHTTPVLYNASVYRDEAGHVLGVFAAARDISERRRMEEALRESEERYRVAIESASDGVALMKGNEHIYVNKRLAEMFGYDDPSALIGRSHSLTVHPDDLARVSQINRMRQEGKPAPSRYEFKGTRKDGTTRNIEVSAARIDYRGEAVSLAYLRDVTDYRNLEDQLRQSHKMEAIGTLAGGIAHDFNNILAAIIGFAEMVEEDLPPESPSIPRIGRVLSAANRGKELVRQILTFSRKAEPTRKALSLSPVIDETIQLLRASLPTTIGIKLDMKAAKDIVLASPTEIQQILLNLAMNASFAMREKGGTLAIYLTNIEFEPDSPVLDEDVEPGVYIQLSVIDTGIGMTANVMKRVFDPFFTTKEVGKGTGMGLAVVYGIVKSLGGTVAVESKPGIGSTFRIFLPVARTDEKSEEVREQVIPKGTERILFVDDEELLMEWGKAVLERLGYMVSALTDSTRALDLFSSDPSAFDLVILDQTMPRLTGLQLTRKLLEIRNNIPIILCTGHSDSVTPEKTKEAGIKEFVMKPLLKKELAEVIRRVLDGA